MKYMILINRKFMVAVDHDGSNGGAEHKILDNYQGIQGAQAFNRDEMGTAYFSDVVQDCVTISLQELQRMSDEYTGAYLELSKARDEVAGIDMQIAELKERISELSNERYHKRKAEMRAWLACKQIKATMNIKED